MFSPIKFIEGFLHMFQAVAFIHKNSLYRYIILPMFLSVSLSFVLLWFGYQETFKLIESYLGTDNFYLKYSISVFSIVLTIFFLILSYQILSSIIITPFLSPLLNKIEKIILIAPQKTRLSLEVRFFIMSIRSFGTEIVLLGLSLFLGLLQPIAMLLIQAYFFGRNQFSYVFEKNCANKTEFKKVYKRFRPYIFGVGLSNYFLFFLLLGFFLVPVLSLTSSALIFYEKRNER